MSLDVLFLTHNYPRHAGDFAGRFIERLARLLTDRGVRVGVLAPHHPGAAEFEEQEGIRVWRFRYGSDAQEVLAYRGDWGGTSIVGPHGLWAHYRFFRAFTKGAFRIVRAESPKVIHAHWWVPAGWIARRLRGRARVIVTLHGTDLRLLQRKTWMRPLAAHVFSGANVITTVSSWMAESLKSLTPGIDSKLRVAPMPPEDSLFSYIERERPGSPPVILSVTRYTEQKRNDVLLRALAILRDRGVDFRARLVGDGGSLRPATETLIRELALSDRISIVGAVPQAKLADEYGQADITVLTAVDEGYGLALLEAQLCGCPVIGSRSGGITDIITDDITGLLVEPGQPEALAAAVMKLLADPGYSRRLAAAGLTSAQEKFSSKAVVDRFLNWYEL